MTARMRAVYQRLQELADPETGVVTPEQVVREAKNPRSVLHHYFEWNQDKAAHEHRLAQARHLIRSVRYVEVITQVELTHVPAYVHVTSPERVSGYRPLDNVKQTREQALEVFNNEIKRARVILERACGIAEVLGLRAELEQILRWLVDIPKAAA